MRNFNEDIACGQLKPIYLIYGDEAWLMEEAVQKLIAIVEPQGGEWSWEILDGALTDADTAVAKARESSLFGTTRLIAIKNINWLEPKGKGNDAKGGVKDASTPLLEYLATPSPDTCLALTVRGDVDKRRKLVQIIQKKGRLVECATPKGNERDAWLAQRFKIAGMKVERRAIAHISVNCANLSQMASEADKLMLYCADTQEIALADALAIVPESSVLTVFELTDAAATKNAAKACESYRRLLRQGEEQQKIFGLLAAQFRNILLVQDLQKRGATSAVIVRELGLHPYVVEKCASISRAFSQRQLIKVLEMLLAADIANKSGRGELEQLLETVILRICAL